MILIKIQQDHQDIFSITLNDHERYQTLDFANALTEFIKNHGKTKVRTGAAGRTAKA